MPERSQETEHHVYLRSNHYLPLPDGGSSAITLIWITVDGPSKMGFSDSSEHTHQISFTKQNTWDKTWQGGQTLPLLSTTDLKHGTDLSLYSGIIVSVTGKPCPLGTQGKGQALPFVWPLTLSLYPGTMVSDGCSAGTGCFEIYI